MTRTRRATVVAALAFVAASAATTRVMTAAPQVTSVGARSVERGAYLVRAMGCNHCHTPYTLGPAGPQPDMSRALSGHPADLVMPAPPSLGASPWVWIGAGTNTAFAGPWGVSFTANLRPIRRPALAVDGGHFIATIRTGRHEGKGRPLLPPMPLPIVRALNDSDMRDLFAYLQSLPPVRNRVPAPIDPPEETR
jgi:cytochrome c553